MKRLYAVCHERFRVGQAYEDAEARIYYMPAGSEEFRKRCRQASIEEVVSLGMGRVLVKKRKVKR